MDRHLFPSSGDTPQEGKKETSISRVAGHHSSRASTEFAVEMAKAHASNPGMEDNMLDADNESMSELEGKKMASTGNRSSSWESNRMGGEGVDDSSEARNKERQRELDTTTPTLVDELDEEEEAEMIALAQMNLSRANPIDNEKEESHLRRTPGANTYLSDQRVSLRRTPGATAMHLSAVAPNDKGDSGEVGDSSALGYRLPLSTPDDRTLHSNQQVPVGNQDDGSALSDRMGDTRHRGPSQDPPDKPPLAPSEALQGAETYSYTPAGLSLSKNPNLQFSRGAFSPNTIRLTQSLDNLLHEEEDNATATSGAADGTQNQLAEMNQHGVDQSAVGGMFSARIPRGNEDVEDSWTKSYILDRDGGRGATTRMPRGGSVRGRRGRGDHSGKRNKSVPGGAANTGGALFARPHQPKPLRRTQAVAMNSDFSFSEFAKPIPGQEHQPNLFAGDGPARELQKPLNFGGAFVPPAKVANFLKRPVAVPATGPMCEASVDNASLPPQDSQQVSASHGNAAASSEFQPSFGRAPAAIHHHYSGFEGGSPFPVNPQPYMGGPLTGASTSTHFQPQTFDFSNPMIGHPMGVPPDAVMGQPVPPFPLNTHIGPHFGQDFMNPHNQQTHPAQFTPAAWTPILPIDFDPTLAHGNSNWPSSPHPSWNAHSEFAYSGQTPMRESPHTLPVPSQSPFAPFQNNDAFIPLESFHANSAVPFRSAESPSVLPEHRFLPSHRTRALVDTAMPMRPRVRSMDSISPTNVPSVGRGRMQSWDHGTRNSKAERKAAQRRSRHADFVTKSKGSSKNKKTSSLEDKARVGNSDSAHRKKTAPGSPKKKKQTKGRARSPSGGARKKDASVRDGKALKSATDPGNFKRTELVESQETRLAFKTFYRSFRAKERTSFQEAEQFALRHLENGSLPENVRWRVYLELADLSKRANKFDDARKLYQKVCELQPYASQGWLEYSKLEEECGRLNKCEAILKRGLEHCKFSESLLSRAIRYKEKVGDLDGARQLLARLKHVGIDKVWRTILEGALLEARAGNDTMARKVLKYLMHHIPWYGPLYLEAYRLERNLGRTEDALAIVERGLKAIPRYGPLWFSAFRVCEALDMSDKLFEMPRTVAMCGRAVDSISRELIWKVHLDAAQMLERAAVQFVAENASATLSNRLSLPRERFGTAITTCPPNLCWKIWLAGGRMELSAGNTEHARQLFLRANEVVPEKGRASALLECARLEEFVDNTDVARAILCRTRREIGSDWKVWLESVQLEIRSGEQRRAIELATTALDIHTGTGRLWAVLVQLRHLDGEAAQNSALKSALKAVPKSGEVWCEGARIHLNPFSSVFNLIKARRHLYFATKFTPQYGDSFVELLRLELVDKWISPVASRLWEEVRPNLFQGNSTSEIPGDEINRYIADGVMVAVRAIKPGIHTGMDAGPTNAKIDPDVASSCRKALEPAMGNKLVDLTELELRCANADPNYGSLWFHCRQSPTDAARTVLARAKENMLEDMTCYAHIYIAALIHRSCVVHVVNQFSPKDGSEQLRSDKSKHENESKSLDDKFVSSPSVGYILRMMNSGDGNDVVLMESTASSSEFVTGLVELNRYTPLQHLSLNDRRKTLFGSDSLLS